MIWIGDIGVISRAKMDCFGGSIRFARSWQWQRQSGTSTLRKLLWGLWGYESKSPVVRYGSPLVRLVFSVQNLLFGAGTSKVLWFRCRIW